MPKLKASSQRPVLAQLHRGTEVVWTRHYSTIVNAYRRAVELSMIIGHPGDVVEFSNTNHGFQIGTVKLHVGGKIDIEWAEWITHEFKESWRENKPNKVGA